MKTPYGMAAGMLGAALAVGSCEDELLVANSDASADTDPATPVSDGSSDAADAEFVPPSEARLTFEAIVLGIDLATDFVFVPGSDSELLVATKTGGLHRFALSRESAAPLGNVQLSNVFTDEGCGVLSLAIDPDFENLPYLYVGRCVDELTTTLSRFRVDDLPNIAASETEMLTVTTDDPPPEDWHRWGSMGFEPDGVTMWALLGDLFFRQLAADPTDKPGSLLRFVPSRMEGVVGFTPAIGNAFDDPADGDPTVFAYGLRSPWRGYRDARGRFWIGDVGEYQVEEVNVATAPGRNFGWPDHEGDCETECDELTNAVTTWNRDSDHAYVLDDPDSEPATKKAVWVGVVYESPALDRYYGLLDGVLLFGDYFMGWVRGLTLARDGSIESDRLLGHLTQVTSVRTGPDGYIYFLTHDGTLHRAVQTLE